MPTQLPTHFPAPIPSVCLPTPPPPILRKDKTLCFGEGQTVSPLYLG